MRTRTIPTVLIALVAALGFAASASAQMCDNTCDGFVSSGPKQGVHSKFDGSAEAILWPPNHKFRTIVISAENEDGDACDVTITGVAQDEPVTGDGSGNHSPDAADCSNAGTSSAVDLRGERSGMGTGRYYHVAYDMEDPDCTMPTDPTDGMDEALVLVPHDQGVAHLDTWVDEGPLFQSAGMPIACSE